jgi:hypothetical protein
MKQYPLTAKNYTPTTALEAKQKHHRKNGLLAENIVGYA